MTPVDYYLAASGQFSGSLNCFGLSIKNSAGTLRVGFLYGPSLVMLHNMNHVMFIGLITHLSSLRPTMVR
jgi:hypothetical protein